MKYEDRKDFRKDISSPILKDPISKNDQDVVKVLLELPKSSSQGLNNGDKGRDLIQFDLHATLGLFAINEEISKKYNVDMDKHDLLLVLNTGENQKHKRYGSFGFSKTGNHKNSFFIRDTLGFRFSFESRTENLSNKPLISQINNITFC